MAKGRDEIEKLLTDEQSTVMKESTFTIAGMTARLIKPDVTLAEWDVEISGMRASDGSPIPTQTHVNDVMAKKADQWFTAPARPVSYRTDRGSAPPK